MLVLQDGTRLRQLKKPNPVRWLPDTELSRVLMFKVRSMQMAMISIVSSGLEGARFGKVVGGWQCEDRGKGDG